MLPAGGDDAVAAGAVLADVGAHVLDGRDGLQADDVDRGAAGRRLLVLVARHRRRREQVGEIDVQAVAGVDAQHQGPRPLVGGAASPGPSGTFGV